MQCNMKKLSKEENIFRTLCYYKREGVSTKHFSIWAFFKKYDHVEKKIFHLKACSWKISLQENSI